MYRTVPYTVKAGKSCRNASSHWELYEYNRRRIINNSLEYQLLNYQIKNCSLAPLAVVSFLEITRQQQ